MFVTTQYSPFFRGTERPPTAHDNQLRSKSTEISTNINAIETKNINLHGTQTFSKVAI